MRKLISIVVMVVVASACGQKSEPAAGSGSGSGSAVSSGSGSGSGSGSFAFNEDVTVVPEKPCKGDCVERCAAHQVSACIAAAVSSHKLADECDAGSVATCTALASHAKSDAERDALTAKATAASAKLAAACDAGDAWACGFAMQHVDDKTAETMRAKACALGLIGACELQIVMSGDDNSPDAATHVRHFASMAARLCKDEHDATICALHARELVHRNDAAAAALRARGIEIATAGCASGAAEPCEWLAGFAAADGDQAGVERAFATAVAGADVGCKAHTRAACVAGGYLWSDDVGAALAVPDEPRFIPIKGRKGDNAKANPFWYEACRLAIANANGQSYTLADPLPECAAAAAVGVNLEALMEPPLRAAPPTPVVITPKHK